MIRIVWATVIVFTSLLSSYGYADDAAAEWLSRMRQAMQQQDYEGRFVYQVGDQLQSMYVVHRLNAGAELERLVALNGDGRQIIRGNQAVACLRSSSHLFNVIKTAFGSAGANEAEPVPTQAIKDYYDLSVGGEYRVAGRNARQIQLMPRDRLRFGYRFFVDQESGLPLRFVMFDSKGATISQLLFVEIKTGSAVTPIEQDVSALDMADKARHRAASRNVPLGEVGWTFDRLPAGYRLMSVRQEPEQGREHLIFSDGIATFSLYVEPAPVRPMDGLSTLGAANIYVQPRLNKQFTAVGEVPPDALRMAVQAVRPR